MTVPLLNRVPNEIWDRIFSNFNTCEKLRIMAVCKKWRDIMSSLFEYTFPAMKYKEKTLAGRKRVLTQMAFQSKNWIQTQETLMDSFQKEGIYGRPKFSCVKITENGVMFFSLKSGKNVYKWDIKTKKKLDVFETDFVCNKFSLSSSTLAICTKKYKSLVVYKNFEERKIKWEIQVDSECNSRFELLNNYIFQICKEEALKIWNLENFEPDSCKVVTYSFHSVWDTRNEWLIIRNSNYKPNIQSFDQSQSIYNYQTGQTIECPRFFSKFVIFENHFIYFYLHTLSAFNWQKGTITVHNFNDLIVDVLFDETCLFAVTVREDKIDQNFNHCSGSIDFHRFDVNELRKDQLICKETFSIQKMGLHYSFSQIFGNFIVLYLSSSIYKLNQLVSSTHKKSWFFEPKETYCASGNYLAILDKESRSPTVFKVPDSECFFVLSSPSFCFVTKDCKLINCLPIPIAENSAADDLGPPQKKQKVEN